MRMLLIPVAIVVAAGLGAAATVVLYQQSHSNSWYAAQPVALRDKLAWCDNHTGLAATDPNCRTAADVKSDNSFQRFHEAAEKLPWPGQK